MARGRALLTDTEREQLAGDHGEQRKYEAVSRARARIRDELVTDLKLFAEYSPELAGELQSVVCSTDRRIYCPVCGEEFDVPSNAVHHLTGATKHDMSPAEVRDRIPEWWYDRQPRLSNYIGTEAEATEEAEGGEAGEKAKESNG